MALSVLRQGFLRGSASKKFISPVIILRPQVATIVSKQLRDPDYQRPPPFDYKNKKFGYFANIFDKAFKRFDENTKIITVEGPVAAGKTKMAKELAEHLDMHYVAPPDFDELYINAYGFDNRSLNPRLPLLTRYQDINAFLQDPTSELTTSMQFNLLQMKLMRYCDALAHLFNTGQGVVMDTSIYSDPVFLETMHRFGFLNKNAYRYLQDATGQTVPELLRPHLVVYLDLPVDQVMEKIKARNLPAEKDSAFYKPDVLGYMERAFKTNFLKDISKHAEVLVYDWTSEVETEDIVEDIEGLEMDNYNEWVTTKGSDWRVTNNEMWQKYRHLYTTDRKKFIQWSNLPTHKVPELFWSGHDKKNHDLVYYAAPGNKYAAGFNPEQGDGVLFKL